MQKVKNCSVHGTLPPEETGIYVRSNRKSGFRLVCKICEREKTRKWREANPEKHIASSMKWKANNREYYNQWCREDRAENPEKHRFYRNNRIKKHGVAKIRQQKVLQYHDLTVEQHNAMIEAQQNKCAICKRAETRKISHKVEGVTALCIDHCHYCEKKGKYIARGLLCHSCNTAIGKFEDNIELMRLAIAYLEKHQHVEVEIDSEKQLATGSIS